jgi:hypothetical protein
MDFGGMNYLAVLAAAVAAFAVGAAWYGILGRPWMRAARIDPAAMKMSPVPFVVSFIAELVMAWLLAGLMAHIGPEAMSVSGGLVTGFFVWLGFVATVLAVNHRYQGFGWMLTLIDGGHWLAVLLAMGAVIGWFGA